MTDLSDPGTGELDLRLLAWHGLTTHREDTRMTETWTPLAIARDVVRRYDESVRQHGPFCPGVDVSRLTTAGADAAFNSADGMTRAWRTLGLGPHSYAVCGPLEDCIHGAVSDALNHRGWRKLLADLGG